MSQRTNKITLLEKRNSGVNFGGNATYTMFDALTSENEPITIGLTENYIAECGIEDLLDSVSGSTILIKDSFNRDGSLQLKAEDRIEEVILNADGKRNFLLTSKANIGALKKSDILIDRQDDLIARTNAKVKIENQKEKALKLASRVAERLAAKAAENALKANEGDDDDEEFVEPELETNNEIPKRKNGK